MKALNVIGEKVLALFENNGWIRWVHEGFRPAYTSEEKQYYVDYAELALGNHCSICLNINGCCFPKNILPQFPLHPHCHCTIVPVSSVEAKPECALEKFTGYIFNKLKNKGKNMFFDWGYDIMDARDLCDEYLRQAKEKYGKGDFFLGKLDRYGQRISIQITLPRKDRIGTVTFISGWMVYPDGVIKLATPYGAK